MKFFKNLPIKIMSVLKEISVIGGNGVIDIVSLKEHIKKVPACLGSIPAPAL